MKKLIIALSLIMSAACLGACANANNTSNPTNPTIQTEEDMNSFIKYINNENYSCSSFCLSSDETIQNLLSMNCLSKDKLEYLSIEIILNEKEVNEFESIELINDNLEINENYDAQLIAFAATLPEERITINNLNYLIPSAEQLDGYKGKTINYLIDEGFEYSGITRDDDDIQYCEVYNDDNLILNIYLDLNGKDNLLDYSQEEILNLSIDKAVFGGYL